MNVKKVLLDENGYTQDGQWRLVPVEPTNFGLNSMVNDGAITLKCHEDMPAVKNRTGIATAVFKAMVKASPVTQPFAYEFPEDLGDLEMPAEGIISANKIELDSLKNQKPAAYCWDYFGRHFTDDPEMLRTLEAEKVPYFALYATPMNTLDRPQWLLSFIKERRALSQNAELHAHETASINFFLDELEKAMPDIEQVTT